MMLDAIQIRVLGSLIEKEIATPENYPLSLNALMNACNQRSSRDPVLDLTEDEVRQAVHSLEELHMVTSIRDTRVPKYEHRVRTVWNLRRDETAVMCLLMLRGPQTPGELRSRSDRLYSFDDLAAVQATLERLATRIEDTASTGPLTTMLVRQPGSREARYAHLLADPEMIAARAPYLSSLVSAPTCASDAAYNTDENSGKHRLSGAEITARLNELTSAVAELRARIDQLEANYPGDCASEG